MQTMTAALVMFGPCWLLAIGLIPQRLAERQPKRMLQLARFGTSASLTAVMSIGLIFLFEGSLRFTMARFDVYLDALALTMLLLVAYAGCLSVSYVRHRSASASAQGRLLKWLALAVGSAMMLVVSGNLIQFAMAWLGLNLAGQRLPRCTAVAQAIGIEARKLLFFSRLGDLCLILAVSVLYHDLGPITFAEIFTAAQAALVDSLSSNVWGLSGAAFLLALSLILRLLPLAYFVLLADATRISSPVLGLLFAWIINACGFVMARMSHVLAINPAAMNLLAISGAAVFLSGVSAILLSNKPDKLLNACMLAQGGFLALQCGVGAFSSAVLSIFVCVVYLVHALCGYGGMGDMTERTQSALATSQHRTNELLLPLFLALTTTFLAALAVGLNPVAQPETVMPGMMLQCLFAYFLWGSLDSSTVQKPIPRVIELMALVGMSYFAMQRCFLIGLQEVVPVASMELALFNERLLGLVLGGILVLLIGHNHAWASARLHFYARPRLGILLHRIARWKWLAAVRQTRGEF